jgi:hypothetical protein
LRVVVERRRASITPSASARSTDARERPTPTISPARPAARSRSAGQRSADQADAENDQFVNATPDTTRAK